MTERVILYHYPLCPSCRLVRLALYEKGMPHALILENPWDRRPAFLEKNPLGDVPVLVEADGQVLTQAVAICEYLNEINPAPDLIGQTPRGRIEVRRLIGWIQDTFYQEVVKPILTERVIKSVQKKGFPNSAVLHAARENYKILMPYIDWLASHRSYLGGRHLSYADLAMAAQISVLDYLGELSWDNLNEAKVWYAKIKSRQSFKSLLQDKIGAIMPAEDYVNLDF